MDHHLSNMGCCNSSLDRQKHVHSLTSSSTHFQNTRHVQKVKIHHVYAYREIFYAYYGNTAVDLDPLPVSRARLTVVEPVLFE